MQRGADGDALRRELENFVIKKTSAGHAQWEAGSGHDDLVSALSLACFVAQESEVIPLVEPFEIKRPYNDFGTQRSGRVSRGMFDMSDKSRDYRGY
jgi:hypothetical protein